MGQQIVDANIVLRYLVKDVETQYKMARKFFKEGEEGLRELLIKPMVIAEVVYVLESFYGNKREDIASRMETFLSQKWLKVEERKIMLSLWPWYRKNLHFVDSYLLASAKNNNQKILTFDKKLAEYSK